MDAGRAAAGHVVVADEQTEGRGRFGRDWRSPLGGLYATYVVPPRPAIALAAGVALLRALDRLSVAASLKWPNDVLVGEKKLGGILAETAGRVVLVGIGINLRDAPLETATSLAAAGGATRRGELVVAIGEELAAPRAREEVLSTYRDRSATLGRAVRVTLASGETIDGTAVDMGDDGQLLIETGSGVRTVSSGDCAHLRA